MTNLQIGIDIVTKATQHDFANRFKEASYLYELSLEYFRKASEEEVSKSNNALILEKIKQYEERNAHIRKYLLPPVSTTENLTTISSNTLVCKNEHLKPEMVSLQVASPPSIPFNRVGNAGSSATTHASMPRSGFPSSTNSPNVSPVSFHNTSPRLQQNQAYPSIPHFDLVTSSPTSNSTLDPKNVSVVQQSKVDNTSQSLAFFTIPQNMQSKQPQQPQQPQQRTAISSFPVVYSASHASSLPSIHVTSPPQIATELTDTSDTGKNGSVSTRSNSAVELGKKLHKGLFSHIIGGMMKHKEPLDSCSNESELKNIIDLMKTAEQESDPKKACTIYKQATEQLIQFLLKRGVRILSPMSIHLHRANIHLVKI